MTTGPPALVTVAGPIGAALMPAPGKQRRRTRIQRQGGVAFGEHADVVVSATTVALPITRPPATT